MCKGGSDDHESVFHPQLESASPKLTMSTASRFVPMKAQACFLDLKEWRNVDSMVVGWVRVGGVDAAIHGGGGGRPLIEQGCRR